MRSKNKQSKSDYWREQVRQADSFNGTATEFCRERGLNLAPFYFWRKRFRTETRSHGRPPVASPFVAVEVLPQDRGDWLPDAKWLAEFVHHLRGVRP